MSKSSVNTGGASQVYIEELMNLRRDYAKADEMIEQLEELVQELKEELYECKNRRD